MGNVSSKRRGFSNASGTPRRFPTKRAGTFRWVLVLFLNLGAVCTSECHRFLDGTLDCAASARAREVVGVR